MENMSPEQKIAHVNQQLQISSAKMREGDQIFNQFMFEKAKAVYMEACQVLMALMKLTQDDAKFSEYLKGQLNYAIQRAEVCKTNMKEALKSKNSAGFYKDNLTIGAF